MASIEVGDRFRTLIPQSTARGMAGRRATKAKFGDEIKTVQQVLPGAKVIDLEGRTHKIKLIAPTGERAAVRRRLPPRRNYIVLRATKEPNLCDGRKNSPRREFFATKELNFYDGYYK